MKYLKFCVYDAKNNSTSIEMKTNYLERSTPIIYKIHRREPNEMFAVNAKLYKFQMVDLKVNDRQMSGLRFMACCSKCVVINLFIVSLLFLLLANYYLCVHTSFTVK